jgi:transcriptional regulator with XRE-family HTH domain
MVNGIFVKLMARIIFAVRLDMKKEEEIRSTLGSNIKRHRMINRLSQEELAERINISANFLSSIEIGKKWISPLTLAKLSDALHIESFELFKPQTAMNLETVKYIDEIFQTVKNSIDAVHTVYRSQTKMGKGVD